LHNHQASDDEKVVQESPFTDADAQLLRLGAWLGCADWSKSRGFAQLWTEPRCESCANL